MNEEDLLVEGTPRKLIQLLSAYTIFYIVYRVFGFKAAVLFGLATNSADLNEARERLAGWY